MFKSLLLLLTIILVGCSSEKSSYKVEKVGDINVYKNDNLSEKDIDKLSLIKQYEIKGVDEEIADTLSYWYSALAADQDSLGNNYILDTHTSSIKKYDSKGKFLSSFSKRGNGPGEMLGVAAMAVSSDKVYAVDYMRNGVIVFDLEGKFIEEIPLNNGFPMHLKKVGKDKFIGIKDNYFQKDGVYYSSKNLTLMNNRFEEISKISQIEFKLDNSIKYTILDYLIPFTTSENRIYVSKNSEDHYSIDVYDFNGKIVDRIERKYRKIAMPKEEAHLFDELLTKKNSGEKGTPLAAKFKKAINNLYYLGDGYLMSLYSVERDKNNMFTFYADIFKDNILVKKVSFENLKGYDFFQLDDRYYFRNQNLLHLKISDAKLTVYDFNKEKLLK